MSTLDTMFNMFKKKKIMVKNLEGNASNEICQISDAKIKANGQHWLCRLGGSSCLALCKPNLIGCIALQIIRLIVLS